MNRLVVPKDWFNDPRWSAEMKRANVGSSWTGDFEYADRRFSKVEFSYQIQLAMNDEVDYGSLETFRDRIDEIIARFDEMLAREVTLPEQVSRGVSSVTAYDTLKRFKLLLQELRRLLRRADEAS